jgi:hypothetical protein
VAGDWATLITAITAEAANTPDTTRLSECDRTSRVSPLRFGRRPAARRAQLYRISFDTRWVPVQLPDKAVTAAISRSRRFYVCFRREISARLRKPGRRVQCLKRQNLLKLSVVPKNSFGPAVEQNL